MAQNTVVIRKYPNRRLYNSSSGKYVNLEDIAALVRSGADVQVVDARTGDDVTRVVLTQIIVEDAKEGPAGLPLELLRQLIITTDRAGREFIMWYLKSAFEAYQKVQSTVHSQLTGMGSAALSPFQIVKNLLTPEPPKPQPDVEELLRRIAELEAHVKPSPRKRRR